MVDCSVRTVSELVKKPDVVAELILRAEESSQPLLFKSFFSKWPAIMLWKGPAGFARLKHLAGKADVQVTGKALRLSFPFVRVLLKNSRPVLFVGNSS